MKYLVNRETKEHRILNEEVGGVTLVHTSVKLWDIVEADPEGWITHDGGECPLPDGWCALEFKYRPESVIYFTHKAELVDWSCVTLYRPIPDKKPEANPVPCATPEESLINRLRASHKAASKLPDIIAELRDVLEPIGYDLVARDPFVESSGYTSGMALYADGWKSEPEPDMTDWRNWREGDELMCVDLDWFDVGLEDFGLGSVYTAASGPRYLDHDDPFISVIDGKGRGMGCPVKNFRFHSRPTKEQDK